MKALKILETNLKELKTYMEQVSSALVNLKKSLMEKYYREIWKYLYPVQTNVVLVSVPILEDIQKSGEKM